MPHPPQSQLEVFPRKRFNVEKEVPKNDPSTMDVVQKTLLKSRKRDSPREQDTGGRRRHNSISLRAMAEKMDLAPTEKQAVPRTPYNSTSFLLNKGRNISEDFPSQGGFDEYGSMADLLDLSFHSYSSHSSATSGDSILNDAAHVPKPLASSTEIQGSRAQDVLVKSQAEEGQTVGYVGGTAALKIHMVGKFGTSSSTSKMSKPVVKDWPNANSSSNMNPTSNDRNPCAANMVGEDLRLKASRSEPAQTKTDLLELYLGTLNATSQPPESEDLMTFASSESQASNDEDGQLLGMANSLKEDQEIGIPAIEQPEYISIADVLGLQIDSLDSS